MTEIEVLRERQEKIMALLGRPIRIADHEAEVAELRGYIARLERHIESRNGRATACRGNLSREGAEIICRAGAENAQLRGDGAAAVAEVERLRGELAGVRAVNTRLGGDVVRYKGEADLRNRQLVEADLRNRQLAEATKKLVAIEAAVLDHHYRLDTASGRVAESAFEAMKRIQGVLGMYWDPGAEKSRREATPEPPCPDCGGEGQVLLCLPHACPRRVACKRCRP